jgi:hypothetical protein
LEAPAVFTWENFDHTRLQGEGLTRDVSLLGAFILTSTCPPNLTSIRVEMALPPLTGINADIRVIGEAQVVRIEHPSGSHGGDGFAVVRCDLNNWSLLTNKKQSVFQSDLAPAVEMDPN